MVTERFENLDAELCQCNWYMYPIGLQKMWIIFMLNFRHSTYIRGYGDIQCSRGSFKAVTNSFVLKKKKIANFDTELGIEKFIDY